MIPQNQNRFQIRLNLIDLVADFVRGNYSEPNPPDEGQDSLFRLLAIYRVDTVRRMQGQPGDLDYLFGTLKVGVRLADEILQTLQDEHSDSLEGWFYGCQPQNPIQGLYNLLKETGLELSWSIMAVEAQYPGLEAGFDAEREDYARTNIPWNFENEAESNE